MFKFVLLFCATLLLFSPLFAIGLRKLAGAPAKRALGANVISFFALLVITSVVGIGGSASAAGEVAQTAAASSAGVAAGLKYVGAALAVALGAISENEKAFGKSLIFVGLAEGVALYGLIIALLLLFMF